MIYNDGSIYAEDDSAGSYAGLYPDGTVDVKSSAGRVTMVSAGNGLIGVINHDGGATPVSGYVAHSPDGTAYKLTPPNGGGAATWVAA